VHRDLNASSELRIHAGTAVVRQHLPVKFTCKCLHSSAFHAAQQASNRTNTRANPMPRKPELAQSLACRAATPPGARHKRWGCSAEGGLDASRAEGGEGRGRPSPTCHGASAQAGQHSPCPSAGVVGEHAVRREQPARGVVVQRAVALGAPKGRGRRRQRVLPRHARRVVVPAAAAVPPHRLGLPRASAFRQKSDETQLRLTHLTLTLTLTLPYPP